MFLEKSQVDVKERAVEKLKNNQDLLFVLWKSENENSNTVLFQVTGIKNAQIIPLEENLAIKISKLENGSWLHAVRFEELIFSKSDEIIRIKKEKSNEKIIDFTNNLIKSFEKFIKNKPKNITSYQSKSIKKIIKNIFEFKSDADLLSEDQLNNLKNIDEKLGSGVSINLQNLEYISN